MMRKRGTARIGLLVMGFGIVVRELIAAAPAPAATVSAPEATLLQQVRELAQRDPAAAAAQLAAAVTADSSAVFLDTLGVNYQRGGQPAKALAAFEAALRRDPDFIPARENVARIRLQQREYRQALVALDAVLERDPDRIWARVSRARLLLQEQRAAEAAADLVTLLDAAFTPGPDHGIAHKGEIWQLLGYARLQQQHPDAAVVALRQALSYAPDDEEVGLQLLQAVLAADGPAAARALARRALARNPRAIELWRLLAAADYEQGRGADALVRLECARLLGVAEPKDLVDLGNLLLDEGMTRAALNRFQEAGAVAAAPVQRLLQGADGLLGLGAVEEALELVNLLAARQPPLPSEQARRNEELRARAQELRGDLRTALALYDELLAQDPLNAALLMRTGAILVRQGQLDEAESRFERAARVDPDQEATTLLRRAQIAVERGHYQVAVRLLEASLQLEFRDYVAKYLDQVRRVAAAD